MLQSWAPVFEGDDLFLFTLLIGLAHEILTRAPRGDLLEDCLSFQPSLFRLAIARRKKASPICWAHLSVLQSLLGLGSQFLDGELCY